MDVAQIVEEIAFLSNTAKVGDLDEKIIGDRNIKPLLGILQKLIDELNQSQSDHRRLHRLSIEAQEHWGNMAQAVLRDKEAGLDIDTLELELITNSKALVDELAQKADEKLEQRRNRRTDNASLSVDSPPSTEQDTLMTDINRQQVSDMLAASEAKMDARLANVDASVKTGFADLRAEFAALRTEIADGRTDAAKQSHDAMKWVIGTVFTTISIGIAIIGLFINLSKSDKTPPAQSGTIVVTVPGATVAPAQPPTVAQPAAK